MPVSVSETPAHQLKQLQRRARIDLRGKLISEEVEDRLHRRIAIGIPDDRPAGSAVEAGADPTYLITHFHVYYPNNALEERTFYQ
jgi:hypothetical protein